jgi:hypothetical protein
MYFIFKVNGRLGNAIFRYMACSTLCIIYNGKYEIMPFNINAIIDEEIFVHITTNNPRLLDQNYLVGEYYHHDTIYKKYKAQIIDFINKNDHIVKTDGILAGDGNQQLFLIKNIINTPHNFNKIYDMVFHIRLGDKVTLNYTISLEKILKLIQNMEIGKYNTIALVCDKCTSYYEEKFLASVIEKLQAKFNTAIICESNDVITDFYIMSNCKVLVCSVSTLSWCAAFFSKTIEKCYMPRHNTSITNSHCDCYYPIDNTELYDI